MKKIKLFTIFILLSVIFFSCSESEEPLTLVGKWELNGGRDYENNKLIESYTLGDGSFIDDESHILIFNDDGTIIYEIDGDSEDCDDGRYGSKKMDSKPQKITLCGEVDGLLTIKSNNLIMTVFDSGNGNRSESEWKRL